MATSLEESKKEVRIVDIHENTYHLAKKLVKNDKNQSSGS